MFESPVTVEVGTGLYANRWVVLNRGKVVTDMATREAAEKVAKTVRANLRELAKSECPLNLNAPNRYLRPE